MKKILVSDWLWRIYGLLFGPIELLLIFLAKGSDDKIGLFKLIGIMLALSFAYHIVPFIIRLILKIVKLDFFNEDNQISTYFTGGLSLILCWLPLLIYATKDEGLVMKIITIIVLLPMIMGQIGIFAWIDSIVHGDSAYENKKGNVSKSKDKPGFSFSMTEFIGKNGRSKTAYTLKNGNISHTTVKDDFGNTEGEFTSFKHKL